MGWITGIGKELQRLNNKNNPHQNYQSINELIKLIGSSQKNETEIANE